RTAPTPIPASPAALGPHTQPGAHDRCSDEHGARWPAWRADGGVLRRTRAWWSGLIVTELTIVHPSGHISERAIGNWDDGAISGLRLLADAVHAHGGRIFAQVGHGGRQDRSWLSERPLLSACALPSPAHGEVPKVATQQEIAGPNGARRRPRGRGGCAYALGDRPAAVDQDHLAGDVRRLVGEQERDHLGDLLRRAES